MNNLFQPRKLKRDFFLGHKFHIKKKEKSHKTSIAQRKKKIVGENFSTFQLVIKKNSFLAIF